MLRGAKRFEPEDANGPELAQLEVNDNSARKLKIALRLLEEAGANVISFRPEGHMRVQSIIRTAAELHGKGVATPGNDLRTLPRAANNRVQPRLPSLLAPGDFGAAAVDGYSRALGAGDGSAKCAGETPFGA